MFVWYAIASRGCQLGTRARGKKRKKRKVLCPDLEARRCATRQVTIYSWHIWYIWQIYIILYHIYTCHIFLAYMVYMANIYYIIPYMYLTYKVFSIYSRLVGAQPVKLTGNFTLCFFSPSGGALQTNRTTTRHGRQRAPLGDLRRFIECDWASVCAHGLG